MLYLFPITYNAGVIKDFKQGFGYLNVNLAFESILNKILET